jgi:DNA-directed RNA polymerase specialized sigma24 family protein
MTIAQLHVAFPETRWTLVRAVQSDGREEAQKAMGQICERYWYPIYAFLRRSQHSAEDAEDLTQAFFLRLIERDSLKDVRHLHVDTRLRSFLLGCLKQLLVDQARHDTAVKRGGGKAPVSFDGMAAEDRYAREPIDRNDPERIFFQTWAHAMFAAVREKLRDSFIQSRPVEMFEVLLPFISLENEPPPYREIAGRIKASEASARILVFRLREKFRDLLREEIAITVLTPEEMASEMVWLQGILLEK